MGPPLELLSLPSLPSLDAPPVLPASVLALSFEPPSLELSLEPPSLEPPALEAPSSLLDASEPPDAPEASLFALPLSALPLSALPPVPDPPDPVVLAPPEPLTVPPSGVGPSVPAVELEVSLEAPLPPALSLEAPMPAASSFEPAVSSFGAPALVPPDPLAALLVSVVSPPGPYGGGSGEPQAITSETARRGLRAAITAV